MTTTATASRQNVAVNAAWSPLNDEASSPWSAVIWVAMDEIDTSSAVPNEPATWLSVLESGWACCTIALSSELTPHVLSGVVMNCRPRAMVV